MEENKNQLQHATSPYLLQHADNPVHWMEWSPEILDKAKLEQKPILISIGYAACHWCHVMAHESFEDEEVAEIMNKSFICIKIDREERPDIDHIYMEAAQMLTGRGGWPLNAFALPDGRPFYAATYFPKDNWKKVLTNVSKAFSNSYDQLEETAEKLTAGIQNAQEFSSLELDTDFKTSNYQDFIVSWQKYIDLKSGGLKGAPKFPMSNSWQFLLQFYDLTSNPFAAEAVTITLKEMALGGIYDQIGGGFSRYAVDDQWFAPHFEKMLYDNALLVKLYARAYKSFRYSLYKKVIHETIEFVNRELSDPQGGFYAALDADSEGEEGKYYVWTYEELSQLLSKKELLIVKEYYHCTEKGNWEPSKNILYAKKTPVEHAEDNDLEVSVFESKLDNLKSKLFRYREERIRPALDDKIITAWNAMMISGLVNAYIALQRQDYLVQAEEAIEFLLRTRLTRDKKLYRTIKNGKSIDGFLDDYAFMIEALIDLYQATFKLDYLNNAKLLIEICFDDFKDEDMVMFQYSSKQGETLISKTFETNDNVIPASNSSLAKSLFQLGKLFDEERYLNASKMMLLQVETKLYKSGPYFANWQILYGWLTYPFFEVAIMGAEAQTKGLQLQSKSKNNCIFLGGKEENLELLKQKSPKKSSETWIYVCENKTCQRPTQNVEQARNLMKVSHT
ncbi:thioredoxin domain-containing protein [Psychroflexus tropicus]|uniref:thioredoxin domain-containing protein n=1 Tax=Psychroflexus tropicus TaxID=197345 RepID=UPI00037FE9DA|nr:thioredoxin domain-containing protein [Psychroflexus tropicus]